MEDMPREIVKLKNSLEKQAEKLLREAKTNLAEKISFYSPETCLNQFMAIYYFNKNM